MRSPLALVGRVVLGTTHQMDHKVHLLYSQRSHLQAVAMALVVLSLQMEDREDRGVEEDLLEQVAQATHQALVRRKEVMAVLP